jgi:hypothetical protein
MLVAMSPSSPVPLPAPIQELVELLIDMPGACAVALGGSRADGSVDARSDWDFAVYYRGALDTAPLSARGTVHPPGSWGRIMNGGAWLVMDGTKVDVLLRGDVVGAMGQAAKAAIERAHAVLAEKRTWVLNEKRILERAGLAGLHALFSEAPRREELVGWVSTVRAALGVD